MDNLDRTGTSRDTSECESGSYNFHEELMQILHGTRHNRALNGDAPPPAAQQDPRLAQQNRTQYDAARSDVSDRISSEMRRLRPDLRYGMLGSPHGWARLATNVRDYLDLNPPELATAPGMTVRQYMENLANCTLSGSNLQIHIADERDQYIIRLTSISDTSVDRSIGIPTEQRTGRR